MRRALAAFAALLVVCPIAQAAEPTRTPIAGWTNIEGSDDGAVLVDVEATTPTASMEDPGAPIATGTNPGTLLQLLEGHTGDVVSLAFAPSRQRLATASLDKTIRIFNASNGTSIRTLRGHEAAVLTVGYSLDGSVLYSGSEDSTVRFWDPETGQERLRVPFPAGAAMAHVAMAPGAEGFAAASSPGLAAQVFRLGENVPITQLTPPDGMIVTGVQWSRTGRYVALAAANQRPPMKGVVILYDANDFRLVFSVPLEDAAANCIAFSPEGDILAIGSSSGNVAVLDIAANSTRFQANVHSGSVLAVAFDAKGRRLLTSGADGTTLILDARNGKGIGTLPISAFTAAFSPDGDRIATNTSPNPPAAAVWSAP